MGGSAPEAPGPGATAFRLAPVIGGATTALKDRVASLDEASSCRAWHAYHAVRARTPRAPALRDRPGRGRPRGVALPPRGRAGGCRPGGGRRLALPHALTGQRRHLYPGHGVDVRRGGRPAGA